MAASGKGSDYALRLLRNYPRVSLGNLKDMPNSRKNKRGLRSKLKGSHGRGNKGQGHRGTLPRIGFEGGQTPLYIRVPKEPYYAQHHLRRQYPPVSLLQLQRMIDLGRLDVNEPIDLTRICNTGLYKYKDCDNFYGVNLTDEGVDLFVSQINIEVQHASEIVIAAIERVGGVITTRYFDPVCIEALSNPLRFFPKLFPIPKCKLPPQDAIEYYTDAKNRGYLADPEKVAEARLELSQKYGYVLPDLTKDPKFELLKRRKDAKQIFFGLQPGWIVDMGKKCVLKPTDKDLKEYYES
ncbi:hypothetical protein KUTeg_016272 [Tegillarca granosa]|uniref:Large ribosomal subunit protein uL15m n=1 Tax=Tegillarca granosa TaxID=220873 RepID=A0ABQ9EQ61_TEGGR|nr:hypothetical protein KUTeg_016272 [Tegillarca granosa]